MSAMAVAEPVLVGARFVSPDLARRQIALLLVGRVHDGLRVGHVMNRGDGTANDAEVLLHDGDDGREAVGGARRRCDDAILRRVVISVVDTIHDVEHGVGGILDRGGDEDALHAAVKVRLELIAGQELAGALEDEFDAVLVPRNRAGVSWVE